MRLLPLCCLLLLSAAVASPAIAGEAQNLDLMTLKEKGARACWVVGETADDVRWRVTPEAGSESNTKRREVKSIVYAFQRQSGAWSQGMEARERGKFAESAELFGNLAAGEREAEQVVGSLEAGASWELDGKFELAAAAFAKVVDKFPEHPLALDARYRLGMVLAMGKDAKADEIVKKLEDDAKLKIGQAANVRAAAIRAVQALNKGDAAELRRQISRASFSPEAERAAWLHFKLFIADAQRAAGQGKEAAQIYESMLPQLADDPAAAARVRLGIGLGKLESDKQGAILALLSLDALPYGSPEQKCEARFHAGRLLWEEVQAMQKDANADERKVAFTAETLDTARLLLQSAAESTAEHPTKAQAAELLKALPLDSIEQAKADAAAKAKAEAKTQGGDKPADTPAPKGK